MLQDTNEHMCRLACERVAWQLVKWFRMFDHDGLSLQMLFDIFVILLLVIWDFLCLIVAEYIPITSHL